MAGYYDETTGEWIDLGEDAAGYTPLDETSGTADMAGYEYKGNNVWSLPTGETVDLSYLSNSQTPLDLSSPSVLAKLLGQIRANPLASAATGAAGLYQLYKQSQQQGGYNKPVPKMEMVRQKVEYDTQPGIAGVYGRKYFTDPRFIAQGDAAAIEAAKTAAAQEAANLRGAQTAVMPQENPYAGKMNLAALKGITTPAAPATRAPVAAQIPQIPQPGQAMAHGGITSLARGGRYLAGSTDGMEDKINTTIDDKEPAKLSHGEFVIPADVVSHLGNGNSEAGAKKLYEMMARVRKARTGNPEQGKQINPNRFMPGGMAYAGGGEVKRFVDGGSTGTTGSTGVTSSGVPLDTSKTSTLSPWVGDYVTNALGQGAAMAAAPYQAYTGKLTAGPSDLQQQAFAGASEVAQTGYTPTQFTTGTFDTSAVSQYMNPYLQAALNPQMAELKRQADIKRLEDASRLTKAGAYGGSRQAIMESEGARNLLDAQRRALGEGYATAYDKAMAQFNKQQEVEMTAQKASEASRQYGSEFGLKSLDYLSSLGKTQREIEQEGLAAQQKQFEEQRDFAYKMPQYQLNLLANLPIGASTTSTDQTGLSAIQSNIAGLASLYKTLANLGQAPTTPTTTG